MRTLDGQFGTNRQTGPQRRALVAEVAGDLPCSGEAFPRRMPCPWTTFMELPMSRAPVRLTCSPSSTPLRDRVASLRPHRAQQINQFRDVIRCHPRIGEDSVDGDSRGLDDPASAVGDRSAYDPLVQVVP